MPSGAKKRKAAKKKKENQSSNQENHGDKDHKHQSQEDKDSDVSEVSSPASQDHHSHHIIISEGEVEEATEVKESQMDEGIQRLKPDEEEESSVRVEREFEIEDGTHKNDEPSLKSYDEGSSRSTSDEESILDTSDSLSAMKPIEETGDSILAKPSIIDSEKIKSLSEKDEEIVGSQADNSVIPPRAVESVAAEENGQANQSSVEEDKVDLLTALGEITQSIEKNDEVLDPKECMASYNAAKPTGDIRIVSEPDSGFTQPFVAASPRPLQTTSWKGCCGLFELFARSGR